MSLLVSETGRLMTYAIVDYGAKEILAGALTIQQADREQKKLQQAHGDKDVRLHNITHPKIPDWLKDLVMADSVYCNRMAEMFVARAATLRQRAAATIAEAEEYEARADKLRVVEDKPRPR